MAKRRDPGGFPIDVDPQRRIFVNRNLRMTSIGAIGFDMDHTLAVYKAVPFERLAYQKAKEKLVRLGYPRAILRLTYQPDFVVRGLLVDKARGNILKMDRHHYVVRAYHGTRKLPSEMRKRLYTLKRRIGPGGSTYATVDTLFSLPEIGLYAQMVDLLDKLEERPNYRLLYDDVRAVVDEAHADGSIKRVIAKKPQRYLEDDPKLPVTLDRMRNHGLRLFLLTNSEASYTGLIMDQLLSGKVPARPHWTDFFDLVVVRAGKPGFFGRYGPLRRLSPKILGTRKRSRERFAYSGGSVHALERALGQGGDRILFFGDHTYGDILRSKRICGWRTAMILERLDDELRQLEATRARRVGLTVLRRRIDRLAGARDFLLQAREGQVPQAALLRFLRERELAGGRRQIPKHLEALEEELATLGRQVQMRERRIEDAFNPYWGPIFRAGRETTHFANQVQEFACIYTSRVSNFLNYPNDKYFVATHVFMPHEL